MKPQLLAVVAALILPGFMTFELFYVDSPQEHRNFTVWQGMSPEDRAVATETWRRLAAFPTEQREQILRRMATLSRMQSRAKHRNGEFRSQAELEQALAETPARLGEALRMPGAAPAEIEGEIRQRTRERLDAFLGNLVASSGRVDLAEADRIRGLGWGSMIQECLELRKSEEIYLYSEVAVPSQVRNQQEVGELLRREPLDALDRTEERRLGVGILGRAGRLLGLTAEERRELAEKPEEDLERRLKRMMVPKVKQLLEERGVEQQRIEQIVRRPYRDLERNLNRLLLEGP